MSDLDKKVAVIWKQLYDERNELWREAENKLEAVRELLSWNGCDCDCGCDSEGHNDDCNRCLACLIAGIVK